MRRTGDSLAQRCWLASLSASVNPGTSDRRARPSRILAPVGRKAAMLSLFKSPPLAPSRKAQGVMAPGDEAMLDGLQHAAFDYFLARTNLSNGLVADTSRPHSPSSIAAVGFALSAYPVGVERGWIGRADAVERVLAVLRFFSKSDQSGTTSATGFRGFYFHFLDIETGARVWQSELSSIDTALLIAGMLTAALYFDAESAAETEVRHLADALYHRVDWRWAQREGGAVSLGWKPECGFLNYGWGRPPSISRTPRSRMSSSSPIVRNWSRTPTWCCACSHRHSM